MRRNLDLSAVIRLYIEAIEIELKKPSKQGISVSLFVDGERVHKLSPLKGRFALRWEKALTLNVWQRSQVTLQVKVDRALRIFENTLGSCILSDHSDWLSYDSDGTPKELHLIGEKIIAKIVFFAPKRVAAAQLVVHRAVESSNDNHTILGHLGVARAAVETIVLVLDHFADIHPIAQVALGTITRAFMHLQQEERYDESVRSLALGMAEMLSFVEATSERAKILMLKRTVSQMLHLIEDASQFILNYNSSSSVGRAVVALVSSENRDRVDHYIKQFRSLRKEFDRGVLVQVFDATDQVLQVVKAAEERSLGDKERSLLDRLPRAFSARYDPTRSCMEGTRCKILKDILDWASSDTALQNFLWIHGLAGAGKSSIAASISHRLEQSQHLGASFFCRRDKPDLRDPTLVLPTIASRLALVYPTYGNAVAAELRKDPDLGSLAIPLQFDGLFVTPLKKLAEAIQQHETPNPFVIVIDALDECGIPKTRKILIDCLLKLPHLAHWLKILVTSRPETDITRILRESDTCRSFPLDVNDEATFDDILLFTQARMAEIARNHDLSSQNWPGEDRVKSFAERAGGLFIWAQTAAAFVSNGQDPDNRMELVLSGGSLVGAYAQLDALYTTALVTTFGEHDDDNIILYREAVGAIVTALSPLSVESLSNLLDARISPPVLRNVVRNLASLLYEDQTNDMVIRVCHLSFIDFVTDSTRCPLRFFIQPHQHHNILAAAALQHMHNSLKFNICGLESSDGFNDDIPDLSQRVLDRIPPPLRYSCVHWMSHVSEVSEDGLSIVALCTVLNGFISAMKVLYWIEALSLMGEVSAAISGLPLVIKWLETHDHPTSLVADVRRFILAFREPIRRSTPHLYISALPLAPKLSLISTHFLPSFPHTISLADRESYWSPCLHTLEGHTNDVVSVALSPDGQRLVSASRDYTIRSWNVGTGLAALEPYRGHTNAVTAVTFSPDGRFLASCSSDCTVRVWDAESDNMFREPFRGHDGPVYCIAFSPDGKQVVSGSGDKTIRTWDIETGAQIVNPYERHHTEVRSIAYSPNGERIASGLIDGSIRVWTIESGNVLGPLKNFHTGTIFSMDFSPDSTRIVSGSSDRTIVVWNPDNGGKLLGPLRGHRGGIRSTKFSNDGQRVVSASSDCTIRIWDSYSGIQLVECRGHTGPVYSACLSITGQIVVSGGADNAVRVWDLDAISASTSCPESDVADSHPVTSLTLSPDGKHIAAGLKDHTVRIWEVDTGAPVCAPLVGHTAKVGAVAFSPDGQSILSGSSDRTLRLWSARTGTTLCEPFVGHTRPVTCAKFSPDGQYFISGSEDKMIRTWNPATTGEVSLPLGHSAGLTSVDFSPHGRYIASSSRDMAVRIWDADTRRILGVLSVAMNTFVWSVAFSPDGLHLAAFSDDESVYLWDVETRTEIWKVEPTGMKGRVCGGFSHDGRCVILGGYSAIQLRDSATGTAIHEPLPGHFSAISGLAVSPDGKFLISGSLDGTVRIWDIDFTDQEHSQELSPDATRLQRPVGLDGWIQRQTANDPMLWVPVEYRYGMWKRAVRVIPPIAINHPRTIDCSRFRHGSAWTEVHGSLGL